MTSTVARHSGSVRKKLGLNDKTLSNWVEKFKKEEQTSLGVTNEEKRLAKANGRIREIEMESRFPTFNQVKNGHSYRICAVCVLSPRLVLFIARSSTVKLELS